MTRCEPGPRCRRAGWLLVAAALACRPVGPAGGAPPAAAASWTTEGAWAPADPAHEWAFPRDHHARREYRNEWWYFTGILVDAAEPARRLGYQLTFFRVGLVRDPPALDSAFAAGDAVMGHAAVTDLASGAHLFSEVIWRAAPPLGGFGAEGDPLLAFARAPPGTEGRWELSLAPDGAFVLSARDETRGLALALTARPARPPLLQGPNGYSRKSTREGYASLYYSFTRLETSGAVTVGGRRVEVSGTSWMDRELGSSQLAPEQKGWDWWSLRLADGRDVTLYVLRRADGSVDFRRGSVRERDGRVTLLGPDGFAVAPRGTWRSPETGAEYPSGWSVSVPSAGLTLVVEPEVKASENASALLPGLSYWEGPVRVLDAGGARAGEGYAELTGYVPEGRLPL